MKTKVTKPKLVLVAPLPSLVVLKDLERPTYDELYGKAKEAVEFPNGEFELYYVERFGWVIPTLHIRNASRRSFNQNPARTYAVAVKDGSICRVGLGPHVKQTIRVFVRRSRLAALKPLLDLRSKGAEDANDVRDRISTRRAQGALRRMNRLF